MNTWTPKHLHLQRLRWKHIHHFYSTTSSLVVRICSTVPFTMSTMYKKYAKWPLSFCFNHFAPPKPTTNVRVEVHQLMPPSISPHLAHHYIHRQCPITLRGFRIKIIQVCLKVESWVVRIANNCSQPSVHILAKPFPSWFSKSYSNRCPSPTRACGKE